MTKPRFLIGIDPGKHTGLAIYDRWTKTADLMTLGIYDAILIVVSYDLGDVEIYIENPNLRKWFGANAAAKKQGAGSIKRDYSIWVEVFTKYGYPFNETNPKHNRTKLNAKAFGCLTGINTRTSSHARDAYMMIFGRI